MSALEDVGRYAAYAVLLWLYAFAVSQLLVRMQRAHRNGRRLRAASWGFALAVVAWDGLFIVMVPITGVISAGLLVAASAIPVTATILGWLVPKLLRVDNGAKSSFASAGELAAARHPFLARLKFIETKPLAAFVPLLIVGLVVLVAAPGSRETTMFRATFGTLFVLGIPSTVFGALVLTMPVLDNNSRDRRLAHGLAFVVIQVFQLGLVLSSLGLPRTTVPVGVLGASLAVSIPVLVAVLMYFLFVTAVPYAVGVRAASRLRKEFHQEERQTVERLSNMLAVPKSDLYDEGLREFHTRCSERIGALKESYFYLDFGIDQLPHNATAMDWQETAAGSDTNAGSCEYLPSGPIDVEKIDQFLRGKLAGRRVVDNNAGGGPRPAGTLAQRELAPATVRGARDDEDDLAGRLALTDDLEAGAIEGDPLEHDARPDEAIEILEEDHVENLPVVSGHPRHNPTYGEILKRLAVARGWADDDPRVESFRLVAQSFEREARFVDPAFIHSRWLEHVRDLSEMIRSDLAMRVHGTDREAAAGRWSDVAGKQKMELAGVDAHATRPKAVVIMTAVGGFIITAVGKAAVTAVWVAFHKPHL